MGNFLSFDVRTFSCFNEISWTERHVFILQIFFRVHDLCSPENKFTQNCIKSFHLWTVTFLLGSFCRILAEFWQNFFFFSLFWFAATFFNFPYFVCGRLCWKSLCQFYVNFFPITWDQRGNFERFYKISNKFKIALLAKNILYLCKIC